jgi:hypothetical protein
MFHDKQFIKTLDSRKDCFQKSVDAGKQRQHYLFFFLLTLVPFIGLLLFLGHWLMVTKADEVMDSLNSWLAKK